MSPRRSDDEENENWKYKRATDIENLFRWAIGIIGLLILIICSLAWSTVLEVKEISLTNQTLSTGNTREIDDIKKQLKESAIWTPEEKEEYKRIKIEVYRKWGYLSNTRGGEEVLLKTPMQQ